MTHYHINVFYSDEDHAWVADIPDLPYCSALGASARSGRGGSRESARAVARSRSCRGQARTGAELSTGVIGFALGPS